MNPGVEGEVGTYVNEIVGTTSGFSLISMRRSRG